MNANPLIRFTHTHMGRERREAVQCRLAYLLDLGLSGVTHGGAGVVEEHK